MEEAAIERDRFRAAIWTLMRFLGAAQVTGLFLSETPLPLAEQTVAGLMVGITRADISYMADNLILMRYLRPPRDGFDRALEVIKTRGSAHDPYAHPYRVGPQGVEVVPEPLNE